MPRMKKEIRYIQAAVILIASLIYMGIKALPVRNNAPAPAEYSYVSRVVDGDTLKLSDGKRVRLIGVDTPEKYYSDKLLKDAKKSKKDIKSIQALGRKASDFTKNLCLDKKVRLEFDIDRHDRYGRLLAYAYLDDGTFINAKIIEEGYGQVMTIPPNVKHAEYFLKLQRQAMSEGRGLWQDGLLQPGDK